MQRFVHAADSALGLLEFDLCKQYIVCAHTSSAFASWLCNVCLGQIFLHAAAQEEWITCILCLNKPAGYEALVN